MRVQISSEARDFLLRKGGAVTVEPPCLESESLCKTTLIPARARAGRPRDTSAYRVIQDGGVMVFLPQDLDTNGQEISIGIVRRVLGLRELVVEGIQVPSEIKQYLEEEQQVGPTMLRLRQGTSSKHS